MHANEGEVPDEWKETLENGRYNLKLVELIPRQSDDEPPAEDEAEAPPKEKPDVIQITVMELYGCPPATEGSTQEISPDSLSMQFSKNGIPGLWTPTNVPEKIEAIIALFPNFADKFVIPEPEVLPPHLALFFRATVLETMDELLPEYEKEIIKLGIFHVDIEKGTVALIGRTLQDYFDLKPKSGKERLVLIVDNTDHDAVLTLSQFEPVYVSADEEIGASDCQHLFKQDAEKQFLDDIPAELVEYLEGPPPELDEDEKAAMQAAAAAAQQQPLPADNSQLDC